MLSREAICAYAAEHADEALALLCELAVIPAPSHHEDRRAAFCEAWLRLHGVTDAFTDPVGNVLIPFGDINGPLVIVCAHSDVVFPETTPLPLTIRDGRVYAPGVGDDTANVVSLLMTAAQLASMRYVPPKGGLLLAVNVGEEGLGNLKGSRRLIDDYGNRVTAFVSFDCHTDEVIDRAVGSKRFCVTCETAGGHSYFDFGVPNAIACLSAVIGELYAMPLLKDGHTSCNVGMIEGGTSVNTIAPRAQMLCELRSDDAKMLACAERQLQELLERHRRDGVLITATCLGERPCGTARDPQRQQALTALAVDTITRYGGAAPARKCGSTDCNVPLSQGIPAVCFGTIAGAGMHTREEYIVIDSIETGLSIALDAVLQLCTL